MDKLRISKTSWGIVIFYDIKEVLNFNENSDDIIKISPKIFLKLNNNRIDENSMKYLEAGIKSILHHIQVFPVCFSIENLQFNFCDFQSEGMYYMFRKWFFEHHGIHNPPVNVSFDKDKNRYVFPDLMLL